MAKEKVGTIAFESCRIIFKNFSGKPDRFNPNGGRRSFSVVLNRQQADDLIEAGWNVKSLESREVGDEPLLYLPVKIKYTDYSRPNIYMVTKSNVILLDEESIDELDHADIENIDLVVRPYFYDVNGKTGISPYVKNMYVTIVEDEFASKYFKASNSESSQEKFRFEKEELPFD